MLLAGETFAFASCVVVPNPVRESSLRMKYFERCHVGNAAGGLVEHVAESKVYGSVFREIVAVLVF